MDFAAFIAQQNPTLVKLSNGICYKVGEYSFSHFVWNESTVLFSKKCDPPPLEALRGRPVVACRAVVDRPFWIFLDPDGRDWNFNLPDRPDRAFIQRLRTLEKRDRLYPQYERQAN